MNTPKISIAVIYKRDDERIKEFLSKLINQTFEDIEIILGAYGDGDYTPELINSSKIRYINFPENNDFKSVEYALIDLLSGEYICILTPETNITEEYIQNLYAETLENNCSKAEIKQNKLYKRNFIENNSNIEELINNKYQKGFEELKISQKEQLNEFYKNTDNTINNKVYDLTVRFNSLEKNLYDKEKQIEENTKNIIQNAINSIQENNSHIYADISKIYDFINSESNKKGEEINKVYNEITTNYKYTEKLNNETKEELKNDINQIYNKINETINEQKIMYNSLNNLIEITKKELTEKIEILSGTNISESETNINTISQINTLEKTIQNNIDKIYLVINENNSKFYNELSNLYREVNEKIMKNGR